MMTTSPGLILLSTTASWASSSELNTRATALTTSRWFMAQAEYFSTEPSGAMLPFRMATEPFSGAFSTGKITWSRVRP